MGPEELALTMTNSAEAEGPGSRLDAARTLERAVAGDRPAFDELILSYQGRVLMTAWRLLGSREDAQDATQEVFLRLYRHLKRLDTKRPLLPWLYRMTVNACHDLYRKRRRTDALPIEDLESAAPSSDPAGEIRRTEQRKIIAAALRTLTEKEREAVVLRDIEGLSTAEVAEALGSTESTVRSQISMARVKIRKFVERLEKRRP